MNGTFNDLLLIPAALPPLLWLQRQLGLRSHDLAPSASEIFGHWLVWSLVCEGLGPLLFQRAVADWHDIIAYAVGALVAGLWWSRPIGFDFLAPHYSWMETLLAGKKLHLCRTTFLAELPPRQHALLAGEGHGRFLTELLKSQPTLKITCVDSSSGMLQVTRSRLRQENLPEDRVTFLQKDFLHWTPQKAEYDLIATHFFLDCFTHEQLGSLIPSLAQSARPGALWLTADFQVPPAGLFIRYRAALILWMMYRFFRIVVRLPAKRIVPTAPFLEKNGFRRQKHREFDWKLLYSELWQKAPGEQLLTSVAAIE